jgi:hypothetical protein
MQDGHHVSTAAASAQQIQIDLFCHPVLDRSPNAAGFYCAMAQAIRKLAPNIVADNPTDLVASSNIPWRSCSPTRPAPQDNGSGDAVKQQSL